MSAFVHLCDFCGVLRHLRDLRSVGDGRVVCKSHPPFKPDPDWVGRGTNQIWEVAAPQPREENQQ